MTPSLRVLVIVTKFHLHLAQTMGVGIIFLLIIIILLVREGAGGGLEYFECFLTHFINFHLCSCVEMRYFCCAYFALFCGRS